jgi:hypothetical protein
VKNNWTNNVAQMFHNEKGYKKTIFLNKKWSKQVGIITSLA